MGGAYDGGEATAWSLDLIEWTVGLQQQRCCIKCPVNNNWSTIYVCAYVWRKGSRARERGILQQAIYRLMKKDIHG